jgi:uncharacterized membrane protein
MRQMTSRLAKSILACFLAGLFVLLPLFLTVAAVVWLAGVVKELIGRGTFVGGILESIGLRFVGEGVFAYILGWVLVLAAIFLLGVIVQFGARRFIIQLIDGVIHRIPLIGRVYGTSKQLVQMFEAKDEAELKAMSVVYCRFGGDGGPGVLALMPTSEQFLFEGRLHHVVIIPTAPVPFGGALLFMPVEDVKPADMSVDGLMSIYVSMGVTAPEFLTHGSRQE